MYVTPKYPEYDDWDKRYNVKANYGMYKFCSIKQVSTFTDDECINFLMRNPFTEGEMKLPEKIRFIFTFCYPEGNR
ncbi:hypothetical protein SprV_0401623400 [Sparganum proliferum]